MRIDRQSLPAAATPVVRGPAQRSISEFLRTHRASPSRGRWARMFGCSPLTDASSNGYFRAVGQLRVAAALDSLGAEWFVTHGIPGPAVGDEEDPSWIDHLVIGPGGVFTVVAYDHAHQSVWASRQAVVVDGHRLPYIRIAQTQVGYLERNLGDATGHSVAATAIVAVIDPGSLQVRDLPRDVAVVASAGLIAALRASESRIDPERVRQLAAMAGRDDTWPGQPGMLTEDQLMVAEADRAEFLRVQHDVTLARIVRSCWTIGVAALVTAILVTVGMLQLLNDRTTAV